MNEPTTNQQYRAGLLADRKCRDCEAAMLASEHDRSRCGPCRAKRNLYRAMRRGDSQDAIERAHERLAVAIEARATLLGRDDGAGDRHAVRAARRLR